MQLIFITRRKNDLLTLARAFASEGHSIFFSQNLNSAFLNKKDTIIILDGKARHEAGNIFVLNDINTYRAYVAIKQYINKNFS